MPIGEAEAIAAARSYAEGQGRPAWREGSVRAARVVVQGCDCWRVTAHDAPQPADTWMDEEVDGGRCIGVGLLNGYRLFSH